MRSKTSNIFITIISVILILVTIFLVATFIVSAVKDIKILDVWNLCFTYIKNIGIAIKDFFVSMYNVVIGWFKK